MKIKARFYGIPCTASIENGVPHLRVENWFLKVAMNFMMKFHMFREIIAGKKIDMPVSFPGME